MAFLIDSVDIWLHNLGPSWILLRKPFLSINPRYFTTTPRMLEMFSMGPGPRLEKISGRSWFFNIFCWLNSIACVYFWNWIFITPLKNQRQEHEKGWISKKRSIAKGKVWSWNILNPQACHIIYILPLGTESIQSYRHVSAQSLTWNPLKKKWRSPPGRHMTSGSIF